MIAIVSLVFRCVKYAGTLALPRSGAKHIGIGGLAAAFVTVLLVKKVYKGVQIGRNVKKVKIKRENLAARKKGLEERSAENYFIKC